MTEHLHEADPRVKRTRQLLLQAFTAVLAEKRSIPSITIRDITQRATVNRATFYAHFEDKD
jgi:AcrR family transcriptional regulator